MLVFIINSHDRRHASAGKTHAQLQQTQNSLEAQLQSGEAADPEFSAAILKRLRLHKAKAKLREIHSDLLQRHMDRTHHIKESVDVAQEMGWDDQEGKQVKAQPPGSSIRRSCLVKCPFFFAIPVMYMFGLSF